MEHVYVKKLFCNLVKENSLNNKRTYFIKKNNFSIIIFLYYILPYKLQDVSCVQRRISITAESMCFPYSVYSYIRKSLKPFWERVSITSQEKRPLNNNNPSDFPFKIKFWVNGRYSSASQLKITQRPFVPQPLVYDKN